MGGGGGKGGIEKNDFLSRRRQKEEEDKSNKIRAKKVFQNFCQILFLLSSFFKMKSTITSLKTSSL